jgi:hypothetical protein
MSDDDVPAPQANRRRSIKDSHIASKWHDSRKELYSHFQAQAMSAFGFDFPIEASHRVTCAMLLIDSARACMDSSDFKDFRKDIRDGILLKDGHEALRYVVCTDCHIVHCI